MKFCIIPLIFPVPRYLQVQLVLPVTEHMILHPHKPAGLGYGVTSISHPFLSLWFFLISYNLCNCAISSQFSLLKYYEIKIPNMLKNGQKKRRIPFGQCLHLFLRFPDILFHHSSELLFCQVHKLCELRLPQQIHRADRAVTLFGYDYLCLVGMLRILIIIIITVQEHNHVRILLNGP